MNIKNYNIKYKGKKIKIFYFDKIELGWYIKNIKGIINIYINNKYKNSIKSYILHKAIKYN